MSELGQKRSSKLYDNKGRFEFNDSAQLMGLMEIGVHMATNFAV